MVSVNIHQTGRPCGTAPYQLSLGVRSTRARASPRGPQGSTFRTMFHVRPFIQPSCIRSTFVRPSSAPCEHSHDSHTLRFRNRSTLLAPRAESDRGRVPEVLALAEPTLGRGAGPRGHRVVARAFGRTCSGVDSKSEFDNLFAQRCKGAHPGSTALLLELLHEDPDS